MNKDIYWFWLTNIRGIGKKRLKYLLDYFDEPENVFYAGEKEIRDVFNSMKYVSKDIVDHFIISRDLDKVKNKFSKLNQQGINFISIHSKDYPKQLKNIYDPPYSLYYRGQLPSSKQLKIAIVGARRCTEYGRKIAEYFARELSQSGITVVSGMARGIDIAAHKGAINGKSKTMAILGCGVNICYPSENIDIMKAIIKKGCVMSEYPINASPVAGNFPLRNRIISGLCDGVIVVEAAKKSGSLITADLALDQGKDVFSIPGRIYDKYSEGTNHLIKMGAKLVSSIDDILEEYAIDISNNRKETELNIEKVLEQNEKIIYSCISIEPIHIDELCRKNNFTIDEIQFIIMKLELKGIIKQLPNKYYIREI